jgi:RNA polymerase sigma factor (sigma-70 family)
LAAAPSIGRASAVESPPPAPEADLTRDLYERYAGQIYGYCLHKLGSREEAEDAVQNTFLNAFRGLRRGVVPQAESAWLFKIAENVCLSRHRSSFRRGRVETPSDLQAIQDVTPSPERREDDLIGLEEALARMPESQRRAILLREWQGLSYREISQEMDLSQAAVETLIFRARRTLAQGLEDEPKTRRWKRMRQAADTGSVIALLKTLFTTGATVKAVATAVAVTTAVVAASSGELASHSHHHATPAKPVTTAPRASPSFSTPLSFAPAASRTGTSRAARAKPKPAAAFVMPLSTVGSISSIPGEMASPAATPVEPPAAPLAPTPAAAPAATPAQTPAATPTPAPQADPPRPVDTPQPPAPAAAPPPAAPPALSSQGLQVVPGAVTPDPSPAPAPTTPVTPPPAKNIVPVAGNPTPAPVPVATTPVVTSTPKPADPTVQPKPVTTPVQTVVSVGGSTTGSGNS